MRSITRSQAMAEKRVQAKKVKTKRVPSEKTRRASAPPDGAADLTAETAVEIAVSEDAGAVPESEDEVIAANSDESDFEEESGDYEDGVDLDEDLEAIEQSGPGQFLIRRNRELLNALFVLRFEVEAMRRVVENGKDTAADRIVRAIDRADAGMAQRARGGNRLLAFLAVLNLVLIGLVVYALWPLSFLPVAAL